MPRPRPPVELVRQPAEERLGERRADGIRQRQEADGGVGEAQRDAEDGQHERYLAVENVHTEVSARKGEEE